MALLQAGKTLLYIGSPAMSVHHVCDLITGYQYDGNKVYKISIKC